MPVPPPATLSEEEWQKALKDVATRIQIHLPELVRKPDPTNQPPASCTMEDTSARAEAEAEDVSMEISDSDGDGLVDEEGGDRDEEDGGVVRERGGDNGEEELSLFVSDDSDSSEEDGLRAASTLDGEERKASVSEPLSVFRFPKTAPAIQESGSDRARMPSIEPDYSPPPPDQTHDTSASLNNLDGAYQPTFPHSTPAATTAMTFNKQTQSPSLDGRASLAVSTTKTRPDIYADIPRSETSLQIRHRAAARLARPGHESQSWMRASKAPTEPPSAAVIVLSKHELEVAIFEYVRAGHFTMSDPRCAESKPGGGAWTPFSWLLMAACVWADWGFWEVATVRRFPGRKQNTITANLNLVKERMVVWFGPREGWKTGFNGQRVRGEGDDGFDQSDGAIEQRQKAQNGPETGQESQKLDETLEIAGRRGNTKAHEAINLDTDTDESGDEGMQDTLALDAEQQTADAEDQTRPRLLKSSVVGDNAARPPPRSKLKVETASNSSRSKTGNSKLFHGHPTPAAKPIPHPVATITRHAGQPLLRPHHIQPSSSVKEQATSTSNTQSTKKPILKPSSRQKVMTGSHSRPAAAPSSIVPSRPSNTTVAVKPEPAPTEIMPMTSTLVPAAANEDPDPTPNTTPSDEHSEAGYKHYLGLVEHRDWLVGVQRMSRPSEHFNKRAQAIKTVVREIKNILHARPGLMEGLSQSLGNTDGNGEDGRSGDGAETDEGGRAEVEEEEEGRERDEEQLAQEDDSEDSEDSEKKQEKTRKKKKKKEKEKREKRRERKAKRPRSRQSEEQQAEFEDDVEGTIPEKSAEPEAENKKSKKKAKRKRHRSDHDRDGEEEEDKEEDDRAAKKRRKKEKKERARFSGG